MSAIRGEALELFATGLDWTSATFKIVYVDTSYTYSAAHNRLDDVGAGARLFTVTVASPDATNGVLTAADPADQTPAAGKTVRGGWLYRDTGVESTSELLVWYDRGPDGALIEASTDINPTTGDPLALTLPVAPYGLLKL